MQFRSFLLLLVSLLLTLHCQTVQNPPAPAPAVNYNAPGSAGTPLAPGTTPPHRMRVDQNRPPNPNPCRRHDLRFVKRQTVPCAPGFNFAPLILEVQRERDAVLNSFYCPARCQHKTPRDHALHTRCEQNGTVARVRLHSSVECSGAVPPLGPVIKIPVAGPVGEVTLEAEVGVPFNFEQSWEANLNLNPVACGEVNTIEYRAPVPTCAGVAFAPYVGEAFSAMNRFHAALTCAAGCTKVGGAIPRYWSWNCVNNEVIVEVQFLSCV